MPERDYHSFAGCVFVIAWSAFWVGLMTVITLLIMYWLIFADQLFNRGFYLAR